MLAMQKEEQQDSPLEPEYIPSEAVKYLKRMHGIDTNVPSIRQRRYRKMKKTGKTYSKVYKRTSLWKQSELDELALEILESQEKQENS